MTRQEIAAELADLLERPVSWVSAERLWGDYTGRERTLDVFNADAREQRDLLRRLRPVRGRLEAAVGGPIVVIFHTRSETARLYHGGTENPA